MKRIDIVRRAGRNLKQAKGRTILTSLAIAVGAFTLTASLAVGEGARQYADKLLKSNIDPQTIVVAKDPSLFGAGGGISGGLRDYSENSTQYGGATFKSLSAKDIQTIKKAPHVESVIPTYLVSAQYVKFETSSKKYVTDITTYDSNVRAQAAAGDMPELGKQIDDDEIVIPESFVETIKKGSSKDYIGKKVTLHLVKVPPQVSPEEIQQALSNGDQAKLQELTKTEVKDVSFKIRAVSAKSSTSFSASNGLFISSSKAKELSDYLTEGTQQYQQYISAVAKIKKGNDPQISADYLNKRHIIAKTAKDIQGLIFTIVNVLQGIVTGFGILALIASVFGIINTQYISVLERISQIGLMKALGMPSKGISRLFRYEAAWIGFIGGVIGSGIAYILGTALNPWITETLSLGDDNSLLIFVWWQVGLLLIFLVIVAILAGWFPARKAAKLDPIEALRTE